MWAIITQWRSCCVTYILIKVNLLSFIFSSSSIAILLYIWCTKCISNWLTQYAKFKELSQHSESLGDLHAMIPGFTDLIGVFAIKVLWHVGVYLAELTLHKFDLMRQLTGFFIRICSSKGSIIRAYAAEFPSCSLFLVSWCWCWCWCWGC